MKEKACDNKIKTEEGVRGVIFEVGAEKGGREEGKEGDRKSGNMEKGREGREGGRKREERGK